MIDLEDEKERILEQLAAMVADASVKPSCGSRRRAWFSATSGAKPRP